MFHQISAVVVASLLFAALWPHLVLRWKQRPYCSKIQSSFCFLPCRTLWIPIKWPLAWKFLLCVLQKVFWVYIFPNFVLVEHILVQKLVKTRSSYRRCSLRKGVLRNYTKFTGKFRPGLQLYKNKRLWHRSFPVNFV